MPLPAVQTVRRLPTGPTAHVPTPSQASDRPQRTRTKVRAGSRQPQRTRTKVRAGSRRPLNHAYRSPRGPPTPPDAHVQKSARAPDAPDPHGRPRAAGPRTHRWTRTPRTVGSRAHFCTCGPGDVGSPRALLYVCTSAVRRPAHVSNTGLWLLRASISAWRTRGTELGGEAPAVRHQRRPVTTSVSVAPNLRSRRRGRLRFALAGFLR